MSLFSRRFALSAAAVAFGLAFTPAASAQTKLVVGAYPANPPWEAKNDKGEFEGFEVDLIKEIAKRVGAVPEISDMGFQALFAATSSSRIDAAISTITITKERLQSQSFTQAYYDSDMALATRGDKMRKIADLKGSTLGALSASTGEIWIKANTEKYGIASSRGYNTQQDLLLDLQAGRIDGAISDLPGMQFAFLKMKDLTIAEVIPTGDQYGVMMRKDHPMLGKVNDAISAMKKDGTLPALHKKWLGADAGASSSTVQERPLPKP